MERDSFIFYRSFKNAVCALPESMRLQMIMAILDYALDGKEPPPDGVERAIFELIRPQLEANNKRYENGKKGGAPKGNKNAAKGKKTTENNQRQPNVNDNVNDNVNVNENDDGVCTRAKKFCDKYHVKIDTHDTHTENLDFDALDRAYAKSAKWLQKSPASLCLSWVVKNYASIVAGKYEDLSETPNSMRIVSDYSADAINALFADANEDL